MSRELRRRGFKVGRLNQIYPYLLRDVRIDRPDIAWVADLTYIRLKHGFVYLVAVMDLYSRYIVSWCQWSLNFYPFWSLKIYPPFKIIHESCASLSLTKPALTFSLSR